MDERIDKVLVNARSLGGIGTTLSFPEMSLSIDIGVCTPAALRTSTVALTHAHADHMAGLHTYLAVRRLFGMASPRVVVPEAVLPGLRACIDAFGALQGRPFEYDLVAARPGEDIELRKDLWLRPFPVRHAVPSLGYVVFRRSSKLRPEHRHLTGPQIARLKEDPAARLFDEVLDPLLAVTGDTTADGLPFSDPLVREARVLFVEATFVGDRHAVDAAHLGQHVHLDELAPMLRGLACKAIVLYHFSQTYRVDEVRAEVAARLPPEVAGRVRLLLPAEEDRL